MGRVRRLNESARAQFLATEEARRGVRLSLLSEVAADYFRLLELDQELEIASRTSDSFAEALKSSPGARKAARPRPWNRRERSRLADAAAAIPSVREQISAAENELSVLLGRNPAPIERTGRPFAELLPPEVPAGLPSAQRASAAPYRT